jgi:hypothetical protein
VNLGDYAAIGAVVAAVAAVVALVLTAITAKAARDQTKIQQELREDAAQPYVRTDDEHGVVMKLVVGNSGPTIATDVKVTIEPPLPNIEQLQGARAAQE